jgi:hypothetical protein
MLEKGLGRWHAPDDRDHDYRMASVLPEAIEAPSHKYWHAGEVLDQGQFPHCVGFSWRKFLDASPLNTNGGPTAQDIYHAAQKIDEWPGESYDGTSVRAGVKVLQSLGHIESYVWAWDAATVAEWVLTRGCVIVGTNWYRGFYRPEGGFLQPTGPIDGGHAYTLIGYSRPRGAFRVLNSWSARWGDQGRAWITGEVLDRLIDEHGEAVAAVERKAA